MVDAKLPPEKSLNDRLLIIHGDDLGMSHSINEANFRALEERAISSISVMPTCPWLSHVAKYAATVPSLDIGLHLTLTSECEDCRWRAVSPTAREQGLLDKTGYLHQNVQSLFSNGIEIRDEIVYQLSALRSVGIDPTHIDSHMMAAMGHAGFFSEYIDVAIQENLVPLLPKRMPRTLEGLDTAVLKTLPIANVIQISRSVPHQAWMTFYLDQIAKLPAGLSVIVVHLGFDSEELRAIRGQREGWDASWRQRDFGVVTSACFKDAVQQSGVKIVTWREVRDLQLRKTALAD